MVLDGKVHLFGGATDPAPERVSISWHEVYVPRADKWECAAPCRRAATMWAA